jgi:hypothetical protein
VVNLCVTSAAASCGRPTFEGAIAHAVERAAALQVRQRVTVQRDRTTGLHFVIRRGEMCDRIFWRGGRNQWCRLVPGHAGQCEPQGPGRA